MTTAHSDRSAPTPDPSPDPAPDDHRTRPPEPDPSGRLDELEIRLSYMEDLLDTLNALVARQTEQIEVLGRELMRLKDRNAPDASTPPGSAPPDERPPHY